MRDSGRRIVLDLVEAIAARHEIDWSSAASSLADPEDVAACQRLHFLASLEGGKPVADRTRTRGAADDEGSWPAWRRAVVALAALQVALGLLGFTLGVPDGRSLSALPALLATAALVAGAGWLSAGGRGDPRTRHLAGLFVLLAAASSRRFVSWLTPTLPPALRPWADAIHLVPESFIPLSLWNFVRHFPRARHLTIVDRYVSAGTRLGMGIGAVLFLDNLFEPLVGVPWRAWLGPLSLASSSGTFWALVFLGCLPPLMASVARVRDAPPKERRAVGVFVAGLLIALGPLAVDTLLWETAPAYRERMAYLDQRGWSTLALYLMVASLPLTTAYAVLHGHLFDVRLALRQLVRRALGPRWLGTAMALGILAFALHLQAHEQDSVKALLSQGSTLVLVSALGLLIAAIAGRGALLRMADRVLLGPAAAWTTRLAQSTSRLRAARSLAELGEALSSEVTRAISVETALLYVRDGPQGRFEPGARVGRPLEADSALVALAEASEAAIRAVAEQEGSLFRLLPARDREWLADHNAALLLPLNDSHGTLIGLITLGPRKTDLPFSREDEAFLGALATAVALTMENQKLRRKGEPEEDGGTAEAAVCYGCRRVEVSGTTCWCGRPLEPIPLPGRVNGKFQIRRLLGSGGMGMVFEAHDLDLLRLVALKTLPRASAEACLRLRREARSMASVTHPNLAEIYGVESWRGVPILVVELLEGGTLADRLGRPWALAEATRLARDVLGALEALHTRGLVHRDVKPSNIGFGKDDVAKLLDFGLARLAEEVEAEVPRPETAPGGNPTAWPETLQYLAGTPRYLSPQAWSGHEISPAQDLWAVAMVLYELLAGRHPLADEAKLERPESVRDIRTFVPDCRAGIADFLATALHADPGARPRSAGEMRRALDQAEGRC